MSLTLRDFGSYYVGGSLYRVTGEPIREIAFTDQTRYPHDPNGHYAVAAAYVQYFVPANRRDGPPVVLLHGGGMTGSLWETTPDGREGWLQGLLARGFEVHVVDNVERGRAGWAPGLWPGSPILRTLEEAWRLFRFGSPEGFASRRAFAGQRFPVEHLETLARHFVPRWTSTTGLQVAALSALLVRLGRATIVAHSQGAAVAAQAMAEAPERVGGFIALEPSGFTKPDPTTPPVSIRIVTGDYLDCDDTWIRLRAGWDSLAREVPGIALMPLANDFAGTSHMMMQDRGSEAVLESLLPVFARMS